MEWNQEKNNNINFILHIYKEIATRVDQSAEQTQRKQNPSNTNQSGPNYNTMQRKQKPKQMRKKSGAKQRSWNYRIYRSCQR